MLTPSSVREVGGDFEPVSSDLLATVPAPGPWESRHGSRIAYLETGRQALAAVEQVLRQEGRRRLVLPEFFCDSMVLPFVRRGWQIVPVRVGRDLFPIPGVLAAAIGTQQHAAVLHTPYFGRAAPDRLADELAAVRQAGARVVVDETHRLFAASAVDADFSMASLRKTLPLYDGAYATGPVSAPQAPAGEDRSALGRLRADAMAAKRRHLDGAHGRDIHLGLFRQANDLVADRLAGRAMSRASRALVQRLDYAAIVRRRRANAVALAAALAHLGVELLADPRESADVPSHLVAVVPQARALQAALAEHGVYCPVHWGRPALVAVSRWPDNVLSFPIDQRYDAEDMARVAQIVSGLPSASYRLTSKELR